MGSSILITGGAGFIGSHLADELLAHGYAVRALDDLTPQVHGPAARSAADGRGSRPGYLADAVELIVGDICDPAVTRRALDGVDAVFHLAAAVGVGQSMYEIARYTRTNNLGTAVLLEALAERPVARLVVASSMSIYGEGRYGRPVAPGDGRDAAAPLGPVGGPRPLDQLKAGDWEVRDSDGAALVPLPTPESHASATGIQSVYALSKFDQERLCLIAGRAYGIPTVALRFFNTYGPRQALRNPYTGVLAIFASRLLQGQPPLINEDGLQQRDFVHVRDVARACRLALEAPASHLAAEGEPVFNVGSGEPRTVLDVAWRLSSVLGRDIPPRLTGAYRMGDIRHCFADIGKARRVLGYAPEISFERGIRDLVRWLEQQAAELAAAPAPVAVSGEAALAELAVRGLAITAARTRGSGTGGRDASSGDAVPGSIGRPAGAPEAHAAAGVAREQVLR